MTKSFFGSIYWQINLFSHINLSINLRHAKDKLADRIKSALAAYRLHLPDIHYEVEKKVEDGGCKGAY